MVIRDAIQGVLGGHNYRLMPHGQHLSFASHALDSRDRARRHAGLQQEIECPT